MVEEFIGSTGCSIRRRISFCIHVVAPSAVDLFTGFWECGWGGCWELDSVLVLFYGGAVGSYIPIGWKVLRVLISEAIGVGEEWVWLPSLACWRPGEGD